MTTPSEKIDRLLDRLFEGRLLPFVGAGISATATSPVDGCFDPSIAYMKGRLARHIRVVLEETQTNAQTNAHLCALMPCEAGGKNGTPLKDFPFNQLADIGNWLFGPRRLCQAVNICGFADLTPLPAHRYLAYLAREGLLAEIISTNYDCCIEKAYRASFGPKPGKWRIDDMLKAIRDLPGYRHDGGLRQTEAGLPTLRLYKINGCAKAYAEGAQPAEQILLTERQLQDFGERRWAHDLLADRARRHALLICGFGSEEPQVRHTALSIMDEFRDHGAQPLKDATPEYIAALPNAPFVAAYGAPSFTQAQIVTAFHQAHVEGWEEKWREDAGASRHIAESVLTGTDAEQLGCGSTNTLSADCFLECLYQAAVGRLLQRLTGREGDFFAWLRGATAHPGDWCSHLLTALYPAAAADSAPFGQRRHLFAAPATGALPLWQFLYAAYHPGQPLLDEQDWYLPFQQESRFILGVMLMLTAPADGLAKACAEPGLGLAVDLAGLRLHLVREGSDMRNRHTGNDSERNIVLRVSIPSRQNLVSEGRWQIEAEKQGNEPTSVRVGRYYTVALHDLVAAARTPENLPQAIRRCFAAAPARKPNVHLIPLDGRRRP